MDQVIIGKFISERRKEKGITQTMLGEKLGVTQKSVSRWETGKNMPDLSLLQSLSAELDVSVSELLKGERISGEEKNVDATIKQVIDYSVESKRCKIFSTRDVDFITGVIVILMVVLLVIGSIVNRQTVPLIVFGLTGILLVFRLFFGKCPGCGRFLPFSIKTFKSCPLCGKNYK